MRLLVLPIIATGEHDLSSSVDQPSHPSAERLARKQTDAVAAGDVAFVVVDAPADIDYSCAIFHQLRDIAGLELFGRRRPAADERSAGGIDGAHVLVVGGVAVLVQDAGQELHYLSGREVRVGETLGAERGLVPGPAADAAEGTASVRGIDRDLVGQAAEPHLQRSQ